MAITISIALASVACALGLLAALYAWRCLPGEIKPSWGNAPEPLDPYEKETGWRNGIDEVIARSVSYSAWATVFALGSAVASAASACLAYWGTH